MNGSPDVKVHLTHDHAFGLLRCMQRIRKFEAKCAELYSAEKIRGFLHLYDGEEAIAAGVIPCLSPEDGVVATYREHGHALARGVPMTLCMAELYGKQEGCSRGRGGSMHFFHAPTNFYGGNAIVGGGLPLALGLGLATKRLGRNGIIACFFGEGAVAEGEFHETLNLAALWKVPVLFICENNRYAMGTALELSESEVDIGRKAQSYGITTAVVDGMNVVAVEIATRKALSHIKGDTGPYFIEAKTYRFRAHSMFDAQLYRPKAEIEAWRQKDPILQFSAWLRENDLLREEELKSMEAELDAEVDAAVAFAEAGTWEPVEGLTKDVYAEKRP